MSAEDWPDYEKRKEKEESCAKFLAKIFGLCYHEWEIVKREADKIGETVYKRCLLCGVEDKNNLWMNRV